MSTTKITLKQIRTLAGAERFAAGEALYQEEALTQPTRTGTIIRALVATDDQPAHAEVQVDDVGISRMACSCDHDPDDTCEHVVATLLTYLYEPEAFVEATPAAELLARSKEELVAIIQAMLNRDPSLADLLTPSTAAPTPQLLDFSRQERLVKRTLTELGRSYLPPPGFGFGLDFGDDNDDFLDALEDEYDVETKFAPVLNVIEQAEQLEAQEEWQSAFNLYRIVADTSAETKGTSFLFEYELFPQVVMRSVVGLVHCLVAFKEDTPFRQRALSTVLNIALWSIRVGLELEESMVSRVILLATPADIDLLNQQLLENKKTTAKSPAQKATFSKIQKALEIARQGDMEATLQHLRDTKQRLLLLLILISLKRGEEAIEIIRAHYMRESQDLLAFLEAIALGGQAELAIPVAIEALSQTWHPASQLAIRNWLTSQYEQTQNYAEILKLHMEHLKSDPNIDSFRAVKTAATHLGTWDELQPTILKQFTDARREDMLIMAHLAAEEWDQAWELVSNTKNLTSYRYYQPLDVLVADATRQTHPDRAAAVYVKYARDNIDLRTRDAYANAAIILAQARDTYQQTNNQAKWQALITSIRDEFKRLHALQDELRKAGL